jgi:hypothetical protein
MARHYASEPRVQRVVDQLVERFLEFGSVNALADALSTAADGGRIYPNRVHGLLSADATRSINTATLDAIDDALGRFSEPAGSGAELRARIQRALAAEAANSADRLEAAHRVADQLDVPLAVVHAVAEVTPTTSGAAPVAGARTPDWSWQDDAVRRSLAALRKGPNHKVGLIVPTGGGKTKISLRVILRWLAESDTDDSVVLWVTHRTRLKVQARRALQQLLAETESVPDSAVGLFSDRVMFTMLSDVRGAIAVHEERITLVVVDEAHHAAAPSYEPLFTDLVVPGLFLTATPNRADDLPIGIDEIAYTITYRDLFERGCVIEPRFDPPLDLFGLDWTSTAGVAELADYLLERAEQDFKKTLVVVSMRERAELLYEAIAELLDERPHHPLVAGDVAFVHGEGASAPGSPNDFLDEFAARPRGILVATSQLVGEGFDDPMLDAAVITYPSTSISHLMQVAGRALRYAPGKAAAHVVQVRESALAYHFEQRWLYQDISDALRPDLIDLRYSSPEDLRARLTGILDSHNVPQTTRARIERDLEGVKVGDDVRLMLTGIPFFAAQDSFDEQAQWGAILVPPSDRDRFVHVFNNISYRSGDLKEQAPFLRDYLAPDHRGGSLWKSYVDLIEAMEYARRELLGIPYAAQEARRYKPNVGSTWLRYVTFAFAPVVPFELEQFLVDAVNRDALIAEFLETPEIWAAATKIELPLAGSHGYLLSGAQASWMLAERSALIERLRELPAEAGLDALASWRSALPGAPTPLRLLDNVGQLLRPERFDAQFLTLQTGTSQAP